MFILPITRAELPGWGKLYRWVRVVDPSAYDRWRDAPTRLIRGKLCRYLIRCDLSNWSERHTFFLRRFYELATQLLMKAALRSGDCFVDIGANIGMLSLLASRLVGEHGRVISCEPNPRCVARIRDVIALNEIHNIEVCQTAISNSIGTATLHVVTDHDGMGTLAELPDDEMTQVTRKFDVEVSSGDEVLKDRKARPTVVKIDVEGLEFRVLQGLQRTLATDRPLVCTETVASHLRRDGVDVVELKRWMHQFGYRPYRLGTARRVLRHELVLQQIGSRHNLTALRDVAWICDGTRTFDRLRRFIRS
jgi:FkbM family methyltransferase